MVALNFRIILQGAALAAMVAMIPLSAEATEMERTRQQQTNAHTISGKANDNSYFDDAAVTAVVKGKILGQKGLDSMDISVETVQGVVTLNGTVDNESQVGLAESVTRNADGVRGVVNNLHYKVTNN